MSSFLIAGDIMSQIAERLASLWGSLPACSALPAGRRPLVPALFDLSTVPSPESELAAPDPFLALFIGSIKCQMATNYRDRPKFLLP